MGKRGVEKIPDFCPLFATLMYCPPHFFSNLSTFKIHKNINMYAYTDQKRNRLVTSCQFCRLVVTCQLVNQAGQSQLNISYSS